MGCIRPSLMYLVLCCVGRSFATGRSLARSVLPAVDKMKQISELEEASGSGL